ncbi:acetyl-CoA carboxylase biotin carboxyl carrier protein subunit [Coprobacter tertius]|uniref:Acetyl-CoA carboxylase biotin carboxyl carrier protein subunit n=1 Tax=Coprobacter tertius TaxID=2944915 RepID=A0ABT1MJY2_9BACT|nr:acetyl-CoA carboxylase biotin carboxyl carrier protein subunit [Coprobacter tertius]MCP9612928.1 acetyl-CoA carboxylase biotin carboxyl carrier protein subunit [Coprobacter tertius]
MEQDKKKLVDFAVTARKYKTTLTQKFIDRPIWKKPVAGEVRSTLPGTVVSLAVKVGDKINAGDLLLVHEAMKMQNRILAPVSGVVSEIPVQEGEHLTKGALILKIEEE